MRGKESHHPSASANKEAQHLASYTNGSTLVKKLRSESAQLQQCLLESSRLNGGQTSVEAWRRCATLAPTPTPTLTLAPTRTSVEAW